MDFNDSKDISERLFHETQETSKITDSFKLRSKFEQPFIENHSSSGEVMESISCDHGNKYNQKFFEIFFNFRII
jgi:hypothetical protein